MVVEIFLQHTVTTKVYKYFKYRPVLCQEVKTGESEQPVVRKLAAQTMQEPRVQFPVTASFPLSSISSPNIKHVFTV